MSAMALSVVPEGVKVSQLLNVRSHAPMKFLQQCESDEGDVTF